MLSQPIYSMKEEDVDCSENTRHNQDVVMPGFRFHPTEEELIEFYLRRKVEGKHFNIDLITVVDLYRYDPWELPALAAIGEKEWYFYVPRDRKYRNGDRPNRVTTSGYWKATGADRMIRSEDSRSIGLKKTLVFYTGKAPKGKRTSWIMNEYRLPRPDQERIQKSELSLCRVYKKAGSDGDKRRRNQAKEEGKGVKATENVVEDEIEAMKSSQTMSNSQSLESVCQTRITHNNNESSSSSPPLSPPERMISTTNTLPLQFSSPSSHHLHFSLLNEMDTKLSHGHMERKQYNYGLATAPDRLLENMQESLVMGNNNNSCGWNNNLNVNDQVVELSLASTPHLYGSPLKAQTLPTMAFEAPSHTHGFATELNAFAHHAGNIPTPTRPSPKLWDWSHHGSSC